MSLSRAQQRYLRGMAQRLKPGVQLGANGLTDGVLEQIENQLAAHELVKVKIRGAERDDRDAYLSRICAVTGAELVHRIGHTASLFRRNPDSPQIRLPEGSP